MLILNSSNITMGHDLHYFIKTSLVIRLFILPNVCILGVVANAFNILCFSNKKMKDLSFKYMLVISISDMFYLALCSYGYIVLCKDCPLYELYFNKLYEIYIEDYFTSCLALFRILADIMLSMQRTFVLLNRPFCSKISYKVILGSLFLASLGYYSPVLFFKKIIAETGCLANSSVNTMIYKIASNEIGSSYYAKVTSATLAVIRIILGVLILSIINIMNVIIFKNRSKKMAFKRRNTNISNFLKKIFDKKFPYFPLFRKKH